MIKRLRLEGYYDDELRLEPIPGLKRVFLRSSGHSSSGSGFHLPSSMQNSEWVGMFKNKYNKTDGWLLFLLELEDRSWLYDQNISIQNVFRTVGPKGTTNLIKFNFKKGTYAFADSGHELETDELIFERPTAYTEVLVDNCTGKEKNFFR